MSKDVEFLGEMLRVMALYSGGRQTAEIFNDPKRQTLTLVAKPEDGKVAFYLQRIGSDGDQPERYRVTLDQLLDDSLVLPSQKSGGMPHGNLNVDLHEKVLDKLWKGPTAKLEYHRPDGGMEK